MASGGRFDKQAVAAWEKVLVVERPIVPDADHRGEFRELMSFSVVAAPDGVAAMLVFKGSKPVGVKINAVAARQFAAALVQGGIDGGWLDEEGDIVVSPQMDRG